MVEVKTSTKNTGCIFFSPVVVSDKWIPGISSVLEFTTSSGFEFVTDSYLFCYTKLCTCIGIGVL